MLVSVFALISGCSIRRFIECLQFAPVNTRLTFHWYVIVIGLAAPAFSSRAVTLMVGILDSSVMANSGPGGSYDKVTFGTSTMAPWPTGGGAVNTGSHPQRREGETSQISRLATTL